MSEKPETEPSPKVCIDCGAVHPLFDSMFKTMFPALVPPNFNLPDGVTDSDISPEPEREESQFVDEFEPREPDFEN